MPKQEEPKNEEKKTKQESSDKSNKKKKKKKKRKKKQEKPKSSKSGKQKSKSKSNMKSFVLGLVGVIVLLLIGGYFFVKSSVNSASENQMVVQAAKFLRLPAAQVNDKKVLYSDYVNVKNALGQFYENQPQGFMANQSESNVSDQAILKLISNKLVESMAKEQGVKVTVKDIEDRKKQLKSQRSDFEKQVQNMYGWSFDQFTKYVVKPNVYFDKWCNKYLEENGQQTTSTEKQARSVLSQIENGSSFEDMASKHGSDATKNQGGDLGWISKGDTVKGFEGAVFSMQPGDTQVVKTQFGHHIVRVEDTRTTSTPQGEQEQVKARHILFQDNSRNACNEEFDKRFEEADKRIMISIHDPFTQGTEAMQQAPQQQVQPQPSQNNQQGGGSQNNQ